MTTDDIARFLRTHPQFFDQHPELLESIHVPHPYGGRAIPLSERQTFALREKVKPEVKAEMIEQVKLADAPAQSKVPAAPSKPGEGEAPADPHAH